MYDVFPNYILLSEILYDFTIDVHGPPSHQLSCGQVVSGNWSDKYCILERQVLWIISSEMLHMVSKSLFYVRPLFR